MIGIIITHASRSKNTGDGDSDVRHTNPQRSLSNNPAPQPATLLPQPTTHSPSSETLHRALDLTAIGTIATLVFSLGRINLHHRPGGFSWFGYLESGVSGCSHGGSKPQPAEAGVREGGSVAARDFRPHVDG